MKRFGRLRIAMLAGLLLLVCVGLAVAIIPALVSVDGLRRTVATQLASLTGQPISVGGNSRFRMLPWPTVTVDSVVIGGEDGAQPIVEGTALEAGLALWPFLIGRVEVASVSLIEPRIAITTDGLGRSNWRTGDSILTLFVPDEGRGSGPRPPRLGQLEIINGQIVYRDVPAQRRTVLSQVDLLITWPTIESRLSITGKVRHNGEDLRISSSVARPAALFRSDISAYEVTLETPALRAQLSGEIFAAGQVRIDGQLSFSSPSLKQLTQWLVPELTGGPETGAVQGTARMTARERTISFEAIRLNVERTRGEGVLALTFASERTGIQGTLDFGQIDATPFLTANWPGFSAVTADEAETVRRDPLGAINVDLRLSANTLVIGGTTIREAALSILTRDGRAEVNIGDGAAYGGRVSGRLLVETQQTRTGPSARSRATLNLQSVRLEDVLREHFGIVRLAGVGNINVEVAGEGATTRAIVESLRGEAQMRVSNGNLAGLDLGTMMRRAERSPIEALLEARSGRTAIEAANATIRVANGIVQTEDMLMRGPGYRLTLRGQTDLTTRQLNMTGAVQGVSSDPNRPPPELPFVIRGPWNEPLVLPNPDALIRR